MPGRGCLRDQPLAKTLGAEYLMGFPGRNVAHGMAFFTFGKRELCVIPPGEGRVEKPGCGFLQMPPMSFFPLTILFFHCNKISHELNFMLSP